MNDTHVFEKVLQCNFYSEGDDTYNTAGAFPYLYERRPDGTLAPPPLGMRSAVPLGGFGTGTVELRADGSFADWLVENGGPGLSEHGKAPRARAPSARCLSTRRWPWWRCN